MNLSGNAVRYWLNQENIDQKRLLVIVDDLALHLVPLDLKQAAVMAVITAQVTYNSSSVSSMHDCVLE